MKKAKAKTTEDDADAAGGVKTYGEAANDSVFVGSENVVADAVTFTSSCDNSINEEKDSFIGDLTMPMLGSTDDSAIPESSPLLLSSDSFIGDLTMPMLGSTDDSAIPESSPLLLSSCKDDVSGDVNPTAGETIQDDGNNSECTPLRMNLSEHQSAVESASNEEKQTKSNSIQRSSRKKKVPTRRGMEVWIDGNWVDVNDRLNDVESIGGDASTDENESRWSKLLQKIAARCCCKQRN